MDDGLLELDLDGGPRAKHAATEESKPTSFIELDLTDDPKAPRCKECDALAPVDEAGRCKICAEAAAPAEALTEAASDFGAIASNAAANAAVTGVADLGANGLGTFGVGFATVEGYVEVLKRGATKRTLDEYASTIRTRGGFTVDVTEAEGSYTVTLSKDGKSETFTAPLIAAAGYGAAAAETDSHESDAGIAAIKARAAAKKAAKAAVVTEAEAPLTIVPTYDHGHVALHHGDVVAGAVADGNGALTHWNGEGPLTVAEVDAVCEAAGVPASWRPKAREAKSYARLAIDKVAKDAGLVVIPEKRDWRNKDQDYDHRWRLHAVATGAATGESAGTVALVVTLKDGELKCDVDTEVATEIAAAYDELKAKEVLQAGHVTTWLGGVIRDRLGGVKYGGCWYVPRETRPLAEKIVEAFCAKKWGTNWMNPMTPIATCAQLARGIANGLAAEVEELSEELAAAGAGNKSGKVGSDGAKTFLKRFRAKAERCAAFGHLLGESLVRETRAKIDEAVKALDGLIDDDPMGISKRFALVWDEIERDLKKEAAAEAAAESES